VPYQAFIVARRSTPNIDAVHLGDEVRAPGIAVKKVPA
jgi:hypothetical protein